MSAAFETSKVLGTKILPSDDVPNSKAFEESGKSRCSLEGTDLVRSFKRAQRLTGLAKCTASIGNGLLRGYPAERFQKLGQH